MSGTIHDGTFVELTYNVTDRKSGHVLSCVEFPLGYIHGHNEILAPSVHKELEGIPGQNISFSQPIKQRMDEMTAGRRSPASRNICEADVDSHATLPRPVAQTNRLPIS